MQQAPSKSNCFLIYRTTIVWWSTPRPSCPYMRWVTARRRGYRRLKDCSRWGRLSPPFKISSTLTPKPKTTAASLFMTVKGIFFLCVKLLAVKLDRCIVVYLTVQVKVNLIYVGNWLLARQQYFKSFKLPSGVTSWLWQNVIIQFIVLVFFFMLFKLKETITIIEF